jgi:hypothetical protein
VANIDQSVVISSLQTRLAAAEERAARLERESADYVIEVVTGIPSKFGGTWGTVEVINRRTGGVLKTTYLSEAQTQRSDGATVLRVFANRPTPAAPTTPERASRTAQPSADSAEIPFGAPSEAKA